MEDACCDGTRVAFVPCVRTAQLGEKPSSESSIILNYSDINLSRVGKQRFLRDNRTPQSFQDNILRHFGLRKAKFSPHPSRTHSHPKKRTGGSVAQTYTRQGITRLVYTVVCCSKASPPKSLPVALGQTTEAFTVLPNVHLALYSHTEGDIAMEVASQATRKMFAQSDFLLREDCYSHYPCLTPRS